MSIASTAELLAVLDELGLLPRGQRQQLQEVADAGVLAQRLVRSGWLTPFQAEEMLAGRGRDLILDQHLLLEPIGEGGMGRVFKARHRRLDRLEAVKVLRPERLDTPEAVKRFLREAKAAARLNHPHIVTIHDAGEANGRHFLAMELVDGQDLARLVDREGPFAPADVCLIVHQAALGLQHMHEHGLLHRDVKPHNLLLTGAISAVAPPAPPLAIKILDLGMARVQPLNMGSVAGTLTPSGLVIGTPDYMAPEQGRNARDADIRSDLYSLGCTAYHLLAGHPPFVGGSMMEKVLRHQVEPAKPLGRLCPEAPAELVAIVARLMEKDPTERFQTPADLAAAVKPLVRELEGMAVQPASPRREPFDPSATVAEHVSRLSLPSRQALAAAPAASPGVRRWPPSAIWLVACAALALLVLVGLAIWRRTVN